MKYSLIYGVVAGGITIALIVATVVLDLPNHLHSQWFGYLIMLTVLSLIFVGVKRYRDVECGGVIRFGRAFLLGLAIALVAGVVYVVGWELFLAVHGHDFMTQYMADYTAGLVTKMRAQGAAPAAIEAKVAEMRQMSAMYEHLWYRAPMTFAEIFPVGLLVALASALLLRNPRVLPDRARA